MTHPGISTTAPLAERMRPSRLAGFYGQEHLVGKGGVLEKIISSGNLPSMIFWGPPGVGKTTLASIIAAELDMPFHTLSAVNSGVKDVRAVFTQVEQQDQKAILFIDEIHRFSKSQQDSLLGAVEKGIIVLIGATTENPSFEVISALLSRCQTYILNPLSREDLMAIAHDAIQRDEVLSSRTINVEETSALLRLSGGDARKLLNALELTVMATPGNEVRITDKRVMEVVQKKMALYDKAGEQHYDIISAFIKSIRGSDPNAAVYYLARMVAGGEDPLFIARRLVILAAEDIGNANPTALVLANNIFQAVHSIGWPESRILLSQCAIYLAVSAKSNSAYQAIENALALVRQTGDLPVPLQIRNAVTGLMKDLGYGADYAYDHASEGNFAGQELMPDKIKGTTLFEPGRNERENEMRNHLRKLWKSKYGY